MSTKKQSSRTYRSAKDVLENMLGGPLSFGDALRSERLCEEMTLKDFAEILEVSAQHLSDIENGRRFVSVDRAAAFAKKLKQSVPLFVQLALEDAIRRSKLKLKVKVEAA